MIERDQFTNLSASLLVAFSSKHDGTMLDRTGTIPQSDIRSRRERWCREVGIDYQHVVNQWVEYSSEATYDRLVTVGQRDAIQNKESVVADALYTRTRGVGLFLPVADCIATIMYDERTQQLALLHLGRHSTMSTLLQKTLLYFVEQGARVEDIAVWMTPSVQKQSYALQYFDESNSPDWLPYCVYRDGQWYIDMQGYNRAVCVRAGVLPSRITISAIDTATNGGYFSHSRGDTSGRIAVVAVMK